MSETPESQTSQTPQAPQRRTPLLVLVWLWVGVPFVYGLYELFQKVVQLFGG
ncbi:MFS transporter small subunit [Prauserella cavernicola]|uniref:Uncharacterized protein n=1 Tax=Prauserella cavernicola TaxID=2800127 RepID=A0A934QTV4_9PSEU|nr:hypothetical protein [Prauserella cavernicola]MBK1786410.1 hypothetical protein [Prauserella cavernicola]